MFQTILVALDHSATSQSVFEKALTLANATNARLVLAHILSPNEQPNLVLPAYLPSYFSELDHDVMRRYREEWQALEQRGLEQLRSFANEARMAGVSAEFIQKIGDPGRLICSMASDWNADLILLGRQQCARTRDVVLGSTSYYVLHHALCSVLVVEQSATSYSQSHLHNQAVILNHNHRNAF